MNAFAKLTEEIANKEVGNRLNSWHEAMISNTRQARTMQQEPEVDWEAVRKKRQMATIYQDMLYGAIGILEELKIVDMGTAHAAERQLDDEIMKGV